MRFVRPAAMQHQSMEQPVNRVVPRAAIGIALLSVMSAAPAAAQETKLDTGDTAWMLTSTVLVLLMTIPGLALFYGGMVRKKNVLATVMQSFAITCLVTVVWMIAGYSLAFTDGGSMTSYIGGLLRPLLPAVGEETPKGTNPQTPFIGFPITFAVLTPPPIPGGSAH